MQGTLGLQSNSQMFSILSFNIPYMDAVNNQLELLASIIGIQTDMLKVVITMVVSLILSPGFHLFKSKFLRNVYGLVPGLAIIIFMIAQIQWILYVVGGPILSYLILKITRRKWKFFISFILGFSYVLFIHTYRYTYDYLSWKVDCSLFVMFLTTKITYYGQFKSKKDNSGQNTGILDFLGYCFFFPCVSIGPTFSYSTYLNFIERRGNYSHVKFSFKASFGILLLGIILMAITSQIIPRFPTDWVIKNQMYLNWNIFIKINSLLIIGFFYRIKFFAAWYITQAGVNFSGISYNGKGDYDHVVIGSILFQFDINPKVRTQYWNSSIQKWLKDVVYQVFNKRIKSGEISTYLTFLASAMWHGVYLTYYIGIFLIYINRLGFFQWGVAVHLTKWVYKWSLSLPNSLSQNILSKFVSLWLSSFLMSVIGMQIVILDWQNAMKFNSDLKYCHWIFLGFCFVLSITIRPPKKKKQKDDDKSQKNEKDEKDDKKKKKKDKTHKNKQQTLNEEQADNISKKD